MGQCLELGMNFMFLFYVVELFIGKPYVIFSEGAAFSPSFILKSSASIFTKLEPEDWI